MTVRKPLVQISGQISELPAGDALAGASPYPVTEDVAQTTHTFVVGNVVYRNGAGTWAKAINTDETKTAGGVVTAVPDANNFTVLKGEGQVTLTTGEWNTVVTGASSGLPVNEYLWLDATAGKFTTTKPTAGYLQPLGQAASSTKLDFFVGSVIVAGAGGGTTDAASVAYIMALRGGRYF